MNTHPVGSSSGQLFQHYRILHTLGSGGMGTVCAAWDTQLERRVALKRLHPHILIDPNATARFLREARAAARIEHANVVRVHRIDSVNDEFFIEMQYVEGCPLSDLLTAGPLSGVQAVHLLRQVLEALAACHSQEVIHCDLKPGNLLVTPDGHVFLTDFGIARALLVIGGENVHNAPTGPLWGTPLYCAPEVCDGGVPNPRWDLYSVGIMLYLALAGSVPTYGGAPDPVAQALLLGNPIPLDEICTDLSPEFTSLIELLMAPDPALRPTSAAEALSLLRQAPEAAADQLDTRSIAFAQATRSEVLATTVRRGTMMASRVRTAGWALLVAAAALAAVFVYWKTPKKEEDPARIATAVSADVAAEPHELTPTLFGVFFAYDDGVHGAELWYGDVQRNMKMVADLIPGPLSSHPRHLFRPVGGNSVVFAATTPDGGEELWSARSVGDGEFEVHRIKDILPGAMGSEPWPLANMNEMVLFYATTLAAGRELWLTNGREQQTAMIADVFPGTGGSALLGPSLVVDPTGVYFLALNADNLGIQIFHYDVASQITMNIGDVCEETGSMARTENALLFANSDSEHGMELWVHDNTENGIRLLADIAPGPASSAPGQFFSWKAKVYFSVHTGAEGTELWVSDGTADGTSLLADINPGPADGNPYGFVDGGTRFYFRAGDAEHGEELWTSEGSPQGTRMVADVWPGFDSGAPYNIVPIGDRVLFSANDGVHGEELWLADCSVSGSSAALVADLWIGSTGSEPHNLVILDKHTGYFALNTSDRGPTVATICWDCDPLEIHLAQLPRGTAATQADR